MGEQPRDGEFYIDLDAPLDEVCLFSWHETNSAPNGRWFLVGPDDQRDRHRLDFDAPDPTPMSPRRVEIVNSYHPAILPKPSNLGALLLVTQRLIYDSTSRRLGLDALKKELDSRVPEGQADFVLRTFAAWGGVRIEKGHRNSLFVRLPSDVMEQHQRRDYLAQIGRDLVRRRDQLQGLVNHGPTVGSVREELVRAVLRRHVPTRFEVATGFIDGSSRQYDVLVFDAANYVPLFREGSLVVVPPDSVRAVIEVKSTLTQSELDDALEILHSVPPGRHTPYPTFKGVLAFSAKCRRIKTLVRWFKNYYAPPAKPHLSDHPFRLGTWLFGPPTMVAVANGPLLSTSYTPGDDSPEPGAVIPWVHGLWPSRSDHSAEAAFLDVLLRHLDVDDAARDAVRTMFWPLMFVDADYEQSRFHPRDWRPLQDVHGGRHGPGAAMARVRAYNDWLSGRLTNAEFAATAARRPTAPAAEVKSPPQPAAPPDPES